MQITDEGDGQARPAMPMVAMVDLQDHLLIATGDLARLETLLADACRSLLARFREATAQLGDPSMQDTAARARAMDLLAGAVTGLQFQDMASQLIAHTCSRLTYCTDRLASAAFSDDPDGDALVHLAPGRANPVVQSGMDAGSVELF